MDNPVTLTVTLQLPAEVVKWLERLAKEQNKTVTEITQEILEAVVLKKGT